MHVALDILPFIEPETFVICCFIALVACKEVFVYLVNLNNIFYALLAPLIVLSTPLQKIIGQLFESLLFIF